MSSIPAVEKIVLPDDLKSELDQFCKDLIQLIPEQLGAIIVYGGVAKDEFDEESSDINLMLVLKRIDLEVLDKINPRLQRGILKLTLSPFILSEEELLSSYNLFPIKFLDIKTNHIVLWGKDYLNECVISEDLLKRNCQRELKNLSLRMNQSYSQHAMFMETLGFRMKKNFSFFLISLNTLVYLKSGESYHNKLSIIKAAIQELKLNAEVLQQLMDYKTGHIQPNNAELKKLFNGFFNMVKSVSSMADAL